MLQVDAAFRGPGAARRALKVFSAEFLTHSMFRSPRKPGGGIYHAHRRHAEQVGLATVIAAPLGVLAAIYLVEYGGGAGSPARSASSST